MSSSARGVVVAVAVATLVGVGGCRHAAGPRVSGMALYANVVALQTDGQVTVTDGSRQLRVRRDQFLVSAGAGGQVFSIVDITARCRGGDPDADVDCTLALLRAQQFELLDEPPADPARAPGAAGSGLSLRAKAALLLVGAAIPLAVAIGTCDFDSCKEIFGVALGLDAILLSFVAFGFH